MNEFVAAATDIDTVTTGIAELAVDGTAHAELQSKAIAVGVVDLTVLHGEEDVLHVGGLAAYAVEGTVDVGVAEEVFATGAVKGDALPLSLDAVVGKVGEHPVKSVATEHYEAVLRAEGFEGAMHDESGIGMEMELTARLEPEGGTFGYHKAVTDEHGPCSGEDGKTISEGYGSEDEGVASPCS